MENISPKIVAAISAAVKAYREEQEAFMEKKETIQQVIVRAERINLWSLAGRQDLMLQRRLWQQRLH